MMIGKAKIQFRAVGCVKCGSENAPAYREAERIKITVGNRRDYVTLYICAPCAGLGDRMLRGGSTESRPTGPARISQPSALNPEPARQRAA